MRKRKSNAGAPTVLDEDMFRKIEQLVMEGKEMTEIAKECGVPYRTMEGWHTRDYEGFKTKMRLWKMERRVKRAEEFSDSLLDTPALDEEGQLSTEILKIKQKESEFIRETLGKRDYSKRSELTGKDGKDLPSPILAHVHSDLGNSQDTILKEAN